MYVYIWIPNCQSINIKSPSDFKEHPVLDSGLPADCSCGSPAMASHVVSWLLWISYCGWVVYPTIYGGIIVEKP